MFGTGGWTTLQRRLRLLKDEEKPNKRLQLDGSQDSRNPTPFRGPGGP